MSEPMQLELFVSDSTDSGANEMDKRSLLAKCRKLFKELDGMATERKVDCLNAIREELSKYSPFANEPVDCVRWVKSETVEANDYNPNSVAPIEMNLLQTSIESDGYTQPIVSWRRDEVHEVVDGFHRHKVGKECDTVRERVLGYLPIVVINDGRHDKGDRMAATIRHNRARGKHKVDSMSEIVVELKRRKWSDARISKELGMEPDEVLRLSQVSGLAEIFKDKEFSEAWEADRFEDD
jgi:ParB-like chromosome segregation protein Spo0J